MDCTYNFLEQYQLFKKIVNHYCSLFPNMPWYENTYTVSSNDGVEFLTFERITQFCKDYSYRPPRFNCWLRSCDFEFTFNHGLKEDQFQMDIRFDETDDKNIILLFNIPIAYALSLYVGDTKYYWQYGIKNAANVLYLATNTFDDYLKIIEKWEKNKEHNIELYEKYKLDSKKLEIIRRKELMEKDFDS